MTTETDKLVEMARAAGFNVGSYADGRPCIGDLDGNDITDKLAAFRDRIIASLCGDVEPVAYSVTCDGHHAGNVFATMEDAIKAMHRLDKSHPNNVRMVVPLIDVATVAALKVRVAELEGVLEKIASKAPYNTRPNSEPGFLRCQHCGYGCNTTQGEKESHAEHCAYIAALTKGQPAPQPQQEQSK